MQGKKDKEIEELKARIERLENALLWMHIPHRFPNGELYVNEFGALVYRGKHGTVTVLGVG